MVNAVSELVSREEKDNAENLLAEMGISEHERLYVPVNPLHLDEFTRNDRKRCYICKTQMYKSFLLQLNSKGFEILLDGTNREDLQSDRPGLQAIEELSIKTPLADAGLDKREIRSLANDFQLSNHDKPSNSCLATRILTGIRICSQNVQQVELCEGFLTKSGVSACRVRLGGDTVTVEVSKRDLERVQQSSLGTEFVAFLATEGLQGSPVTFTMRT